MEVMVIPNKSHDGSNFILILLITLSLFCVVRPTSTELVVNVKNQGGEVFQESIWANLSDQTIHLEVAGPDGSIVVQFIDFQNDIQIINALILGEEEQRESQFQVLCFVTHIQKTEFIPVDAMVKLRQRNPWTIRMPDRDMGKENVTLDVLLDIRSTDWISPHIKHICSDAKDTTYGKLDELEAIVASRSSIRSANDSSAMNEVEDIPGADRSVEAHEMFLRTVKPFPLLPLDCDSTSDINKPCQCQLELCIGWYPCALKYCRTHDANGKSTSSSYRCGIHTCKKCQSFSYSVSRKFSCL